MQREDNTGYTRFAQELMALQAEILQGAFGAPGDTFLTTRKLAELRGVSVVTAHNLLRALCENGYTELRGKKYFLSHGEHAARHEARTKIIGLIIPTAANEFFASVADAVIAAAREKGYTVLTLATNYSAGEERRAHALFQSLSVAGIICCVPPAAENMAFYREGALPCVLLSQSLEGNFTSSVQVNSFSVSQKAAQHLIACGYRRFLYAGTRNISPESDVRFTAFRMELGRSGFPLARQDTLLLSGNGDAERAALAGVLKQITEPVGIFCYHDLIAARIYSVCEMLGKRIPEDVGIIGFDDLSIAKLLSPPLTTVRYRIPSMADMAVKLLLEERENPGLRRDNFYVEPMLVVRESTRIS